MAPDAATWTATLVANPSTLQYFLIALLFGCAISFGPIYMLCYSLTPPLVLGYAIGLILGHPMDGAILGAYIGLIYMGVISVGGTQPSNPMIGTVVGVVVAFKGGLGYEAALAIAVPVGIAFASLRNWVNTLACFFTANLDRSVEKRNPGAMWFWGAANMFFKVAIFTIMMFLVMVLGIDQISAAMNNLPAWASTGLNVAGNALPAVGIGLGLVFIGGNGKIFYMIISFILCEYLGLSTLVLVVLAVCVLVIYTYGRIQNGTLDLSFFKNAEVRKNHILTAKDAIKATFITENFIEWGNNTATKNAEAIMLGLSTVMKKLYPGDVNRQMEELEKHTQFINTNYQFLGMLVAPYVAMEEERALGNENITPETIRAFGSSMQGPVAAIGDPMVQSVYNTIIKSVGISMVLAGSIAGVYFTYFGFVIFKVVAAILIGWLGYKYGGALIEKLYSSGAANYFTNIAGIVGCVAFGALAASTVKLNLGLVIADVNLQTTMLDAIMKGILPLALTLCCFGILKKRKMSTVLLLCVVFFGAFALGALGICA
ncbi:MAG: PTS system mannose/fructose/sorbose family transporter subunit IID [Clostridiales bacterium]|nr:PTS system mannose/fructose/sorbose family transporter subunit IID [Clostridiales bacterium]